MDLIASTRFLASVQLFDCIWRVIFHELREILEEPDAADYLTSTYFREVPVLVATELVYADRAYGNAGPVGVREAGRVCYPSAKRAVSALKALVRWAEFRRLA